MPPRATDTVPNTPLSGGDLRKIMLRHFEDLLANEGLLSEYLAYGRVAFSIVLRMHMANPHHPQSEIEFTSRRIARNIVSHDPALAAIESPPLAHPTPAAADSVVSATERVVRIDSPNAERLRHGLPVSVERRQLDGTKIVEKVVYPPDASIGEGNVETRDVTAATAERWGVGAGQRPAVPVDDKSVEVVPAGADVVDPAAL